MSNEQIDHFCHCHNVALPEEFLDQAGSEDFQVMSSKEEDVLKEKHFFEGSLVFEMHVAEKEQV